MRWKEWRRGRGDSLGIQDAKVGFKFQEANCECQGVLKNSECQKVLSTTHYTNSIKFYTITYLL